MKSLADQLPPEIAREIHPAWRKNEADYWAARDQLLVQYKGQWVAYADGTVIAFGPNRMEVLVAADPANRHPFVALVGRENEPFRMRRVHFPYDTTYQGAALPVLQVEYRKVSGQSGLVLDQVIPDTGADRSALPWADYQQLQFTLAQGMPAVMGGVAGGSATTVTFQLWVHLDGQDFPCEAYADFLGSERLLGREVLNSLDVLFRGPAREVVINP